MAAVQWSLTLQSSPQAQPLESLLPSAWLRPRPLSQPETLALTPTHPGAITWPGCAHSSRTTPARSDLSLRSARTQPPEPARAGGSPEGCAEAAAASNTANTEPMRTVSPAATLHSSRRSGPGPGQRTSATAAGGVPSAGTRSAGGASIAANRFAAEMRREGAQGLVPIADRRTGGPAGGRATLAQAAAVAALRFPLLHRLPPAAQVRADFRDSVWRHTTPRACARGPACKH